MTEHERIRIQVAWLMWCLNQGYQNAQDRAILMNWFLEDLETLRPEDVVIRAHLLAMADQVIALVRSAP